MQAVLHPPRLRQQQGVSLFIVIIFVMMTMLLALWGSRSALVNEMIVGNDADYQRAFEAAQALVQDAEFDIQGNQPNGSSCVPQSSNPQICRAQGSANKVEIPVIDSDFSTLVTVLGTEPTQCLDGICLKRTGNQDFWSDKTTFDAMIATGVGARYGQFTGAQTGTSTSKASNSLLKNTSAGQGGWYWIEVMQYDANADNTALVSNQEPFLSLNLKPNMVYRITAIARGLKPHTQVVLQSTFVLQKNKD